MAPNKACTVAETFAMIPIGKLLLPNRRVVTQSTMVEGLPVSFQDRFLNLMSMWASLGDPKDLPPPSSFPEGWSIGKADLVFEIPENYVVPAQGVVEYVRFRVPTRFSEDRWIQAAEAQPGDRTVVHHVVVYVDDHKKD